MNKPNWTKNTNAQIQGKDQQLPVAGWGVGEGQMDQRLQLCQEENQTFGGERAVVYREVETLLYT